EQAAGGLRVHEVVQRLAADRGLLAQPGGVAGQLLEELGHALRRRSRTELRKLPARNVDGCSPGGARRLVPHRALLLGPSRRSPPACAPPARPAPREWPGASRRSARPSPGGRAAPSPWRPLDRAPERAAPPAALPSPRPAR